MLQRMSPLVAQSGHRLLHCTRPLSGAKRIRPFALHMCAFDLKRTLFIALRISAFCGKANMSSAVLGTVATAIQVRAAKGANALVGQRATTASPAKEEGREKGGC